MSRRSSNRGPRKRSQNGATNTAVSLVKQTDSPDPGGQLLRRVVIGRRLSTVAGWRRELTRIYREARRGELPYENATRLTYIANVAVQVVRLEEQLQKIDQLRRELALRRGEEIPQLTSDIEADPLTDALASAVPDVDAGQQQLEVQS